MKSRISFALFFVLLMGSKLSFANSTIECRGIGENGAEYRLGISRVETGIIFVNAEKDTETIFSGNAQAYQTGDGINGYYFTKYWGVDSQERTLIVSIDSNQRYSLIAPELIEELNCVLQENRF